MEEFVETPPTASRLARHVGKMRPRFPCLENLPSEIILTITGHLLAEEELNHYEQDEEISYGYEPKAEDCPPMFLGVRAATRLAATCRRLRGIADPAIIRHDVRHHYSSCLLLSSKKGCVSGVTKALRYGTDINTPDRTMFDFSFCDEDCYQVMRRWPTQSTFTALHWAAFYGHEDLLVYLLEHGADVNARANVGVASTSTEGRRCNLSEENIQFAILSHTQWDYDSNSNHAEFNTHIGDGGTIPGDAQKVLGVGASPLFLALRACTDDTSLRQYRPGKWDFNEWAPIVASDNTGCRAAVVRKLVKAGASLITATKNNTHALHQACAYRDFDVVEFLISEMDVDANVADEDGNTAAHYMAMHNLYERDVGKWNRISFPDLREALILRLLLSRGLDLHRLNGEEMTAMDMGLDITGMDLTTGSCSSTISSPASSSTTSFSTSWCSTE